MRNWLVAIWLAMVPAVAQDRAIEIDPAQTKVAFKLSATLHSVRGSFQIKRCNIRFDPATSRFTGELVLDATSAATGNSDRDRTMHQKVLESGRFPEIVFRPAKVNGTLAAAGTSKLELIGQLAIHGAERELSIPLVVDVSGNRYRLTGEFSFSVCEMGNEKSKHAGSACERRGNGRNSRGRGTTLARLLTSFSIDLSRSKA